MKFILRKENDKLKIVGTTSNEVEIKPIYEFKDGFHYFTHDEGILKIPENEFFPNGNFKRFCKIHGVTFNKAIDEAIAFFKERVKWYDSLIDTPKQQLEKMYLLIKSHHTISGGKTIAELMADPKKIEFDNEKLNTASQWVDEKRHNVRQQIIFEKLEEKKDLLNYELLLLDKYEKELKAMSDTNEINVINEQKADGRKKNALSQPKICALIWYLSKYENKYQITDISGTGTVLDAVTQAFKDFRFDGQPASAETKFAAIRTNLDRESYENIVKFSEYQKIIECLKEYPNAQKELKKSLFNYNEQLKRPK